MLMSFLPDSSSSVSLQPMQNFWTMLEHEWEFIVQASLLPQVQAGSVSV